MPYNTGDICRYYKTICEQTGGADQYACHTQQCCEDFDRYDNSTKTTSCIRECLISDDVVFIKMTDISPTELSDLRFISHFYCYVTCSGGIVLGIKVLWKGAPDSCKPTLEIVEDAMKKDLSSFSSAVRKYTDLFK